MSEEASGLTVCAAYRVAGATYVAATSTDKALMTSLGVDKVIDHLHEEWWKDPEFKENPLDVIVDAAEGKVAWERAKTGILKSGSKGGRFLAVAMPNPAQEFKSILPMIGFMCETLMKTAYSRVASSMVPRFVPELATVNGALLEQVLKTAEAGRLKVVLDPGSPFPFTKEGVVEAFKLQASTLHPQDDDKGRRGPHGKIVIKISDE